MKSLHSVILVDDETPAEGLVKALRSGAFTEFDWPPHTTIGEFSLAAIAHFIALEDRHDHKVLTAHVNQSLASMSSGEQKKALLHHLLAQDFEVLLLVHPYDSLDQETQEELKQTFCSIADKVRMIQIVSRKADILPFVSEFYKYDAQGLQAFGSREEFMAADSASKAGNDLKVPEPLETLPFKNKLLISFKEVSVQFDGKAVLSGIDWNISQGEFWQLIGPNGSGKSTLVQLITGDSHKGYGQDITLFGHKKGSGESVWDIKAFLGYFSPSMIDRFRRRQTLMEMLLSGLRDSVGLYQVPSAREKRKAREWLHLLGMEDGEQRYFHTLGKGAKRLVMTARALIKHPPLVLLDEPTVGLDDASAALFVQLVNAYAQQSASALVYVSHRPEVGLQPQKRFHLVPGRAGSTGRIAG